LFTVLAALLPFPLPVYGITFIIPLQIAQTVITSMGAVTTGLPVFSFSNRLALILFIAVTSFPSVLIFKRAAALSGERKKQPSRFFRLVSRFILLAACMGALTVYVRNQTPQAAPVRRFIAENQDKPGILDLTVTGSTFLSRRILEITLSARAAPVRFDLYLDSESGRPSIYTAPMPFVIKEDPPRGSTLEFILGENPPNPFTANMVLPLNFSGVLRVEALYTRYDPALDTGPPPEGDDYVLRVTRTIPL
jgi:energy-converting hydrogenase Eha subunit E